MAATNKAGATTFTTPSDREIVMTRVFDAPRRLVLEAWTSPEHLPHWMTGPPGWTMPVCEIDLRPGGAWRFVWRKADGTEMEMRGVYREVVPPERLVSTESWGGDWPETLNTLDLVRGGRQDDGHDHGALSLEGGPRRGARDGDEGGHVPELRSPRRAAADDGVRGRQSPGGRSGRIDAARTAASMPSPARIASARSRMRRAARRLSPGDPGLGHRGEEVPVQGIDPGAQDAGQVGHSPPVPDRRPAIGRGRPAGRAWRPRSARRRRRASRPHPAPGRRRGRRRPRAGPTRPGSSTGAFEAHFHRATSCMTTRRLCISPSRRSTPVRDRGHGGRVRRGTAGGDGEHHQQDRGDSSHAGILPATAKAPDCGH